jgi:hypothetical protein
MKWFFLVCFVAGMFCCFFYTAVIVFAIVTSRLVGMGIIRGGAFVAGLPFLVWGTQGMFRSFKGARVNE